MKTITTQQFEADFDAILTDVMENKQYYHITDCEKPVVLMPCDEYMVLKDTYQEWVEESRVDPLVMIEGTGEEQKINQPL